MAKSLDFNALKKKYFTVKLADEKKTTLLIGTPTKAIFNSFLNIKDALEDDSIGDEAIDELYDIVAKIMSHNKGRVTITKEMIEDLMDYEDVIFFIRMYTDFISEVTGSKN